MVYRNAHILCIVHKLVNLVFIRAERMVYIPLISRVRGPYGKLWTEFFFLSFIAQARSEDP